MPRASRLWMPKCRRLLDDLLGILKVAVISGGDWPQFEKQVLSHLPHDEQPGEPIDSSNLWNKVLPIQSRIGRSSIRKTSHRRKKRKLSALSRRRSQRPDSRSTKVWGEAIEDRGSQITYSALGQEAPLEQKTKWDPDFAKRKKIKTILDTLIPKFSVRMGGATSIDITKPGIDKAYGIGKLRDVLGISLKEMIFVGDALFPGGNDYPAEQAGVISIPVRGPHETKRVIETMIACLSDHGQEALKL